MPGKAVLSRTDISIVYDSIMAQYNPVKGRGTAYSWSKNIPQLRKECNRLRQIYQRVGDHKMTRVTAIKVYQ